MAKTTAFICDSDPASEAASPYPLPAHAATIWASGANLWLVLGPTERQGRSHRIMLPATEQGLATLLRLLQDREMQGPLPIGAGLGSADQALAVHWRRHQVWTSPLCPHCKAEGRGSSAKRPSKYFDTKMLGDVKVRKIRKGETAKSAAANAPARLDCSPEDLGL